MLLTRIATTNFLGLPSFDVQLAPYTGIAGPNGTGKTSIRDAIRFVLMPEAGVRDVTTKKAFGELLSDGAEKGAVTLELDGRTVSRSVATGDLLGKVPMPALPPCLPWLLDPRGFALAPAAEKRKGLSALLGLTASIDGIVDRLTRAGLPEAIVQDLKPAIARGFVDAEKHAANRATEARGAWKALTGENYGAVKAETWAPPAFSRETGPQPEDVLKVLDEKRKYDAEIAGVNQAIGAASRALEAAKREAYKKWADKLPDYEASKKRGVAARVALEAAIADLEAKARGNSGITALCPCCGEQVVIDGGTLRKPVELQGPEQLEAHAALAAKREELVKVDSQLTALQQNIDTASEAVRQLAAHANDSTEDVETLRGRLVDLERHRDGLVEKARTMQADVDEAARHDGLEAKAKAEHERVGHYTKATELLSPNGIPAQLLAEVLDPFNDVLVALSASAGIETVSLDPEMVLRYGRRRFGLCSESQQWRVEAILALTFARLAKFPLVVLDRLDVLDVPSRNTFIPWLQAEAAAGTQIVVGGTLKGVPPSTAAAKWVWLDAKAVGLVA